jgi:hypothetical protein
VEAITLASEVVTMPKLDLEEKSKMGCTKYYSQIANLLAEEGGWPLRAPFVIRDLRVITATSQKIQDIR